MTNKLADAFIAIRDHDWKLHDTGNRKILVPPSTDERRNWCAEWDENGLPHWLPKYSLEQYKSGNEGVIPTEELPIYGAE